MAAATVAPSVPHNVHTVLNYYKEAEDGSPPAPYYINKPLEQQTPRPSISVDVDVTDISGQEEKYTLDVQGFQVVKHESTVKEFHDDDLTKRVYYPEVEQLLKDVTGATRVFIFDHTVRQGKKPGEQPGASFRGPVQMVHIDQSYRASVNRVRYHLPEEAEELLRKRFQIINVWRPIKTILKDPLGVADARSVAESDLVGAALIYPDREGETFAVKPNPAHRWFFKYAQRPDEVTLIKCYDSATDPGVARRIPHSSFVDPAEEDKEPRESIEVRALVFYDY